MPKKDDDEKKNKRRKTIKDIFDDFMIDDHSKKSFFEYLKQNSDEIKKRGDFSVGGFSIRYNPLTGKTDVKKFGDSDLQLPNFMRNSDHEDPCHGCTMCDDIIDDIEKSNCIEPLADVIDFEEYVEIVLQMPAITKKQIKVFIEKNAKTVKSVVTISADNGDLKYRKELQLEGLVNKKGIKGTINNGIVTIKMNITKS
jgi:HSP20 family molecular chaperone IbpA